MTCLFSLTSRAHVDFHSMVVNSGEALGGGWGQPSRQFSTIMHSTFALVFRMGVFQLFHWSNTFLSSLSSASFHTHAQPLNNDTNDQDGYYRILFALANYQFHGGAQNYDF